MSIWEGAVVAITGGTGSLGSAFLRHCLDTLKVKTVRCFSRDELKQAELAATLSPKELHRCRFLLGDVRDLARLRRALEGVDIVVHAAALKRVDLVAHDPFETVQTNVLGTMNVLNAAIDVGVSRVIGISTDKSASANNIYGATKFILERLMVYGNVYAGAREVRCSATRYGNVLGSRGSILGIWAGQRAAGQPLRVAQGVTRFWLTLPQACAIITHAGETMRGGEVFVPELPHSSLTTLAVAAYPDAPRESCPLRVGGEKLHETLLTGHERPYASPVSQEAFRGWVLRSTGGPDRAPSASAEGQSYGLSVRSSDLPHLTVLECRELLAEVGLLPARERGAKDGGAPDDRAA